MPAMAPVLSLTATALLLTDDDDPELFEAVVGVSVRPPVRLGLNEEEVTGVKAAVGAAVLVGCALDGALVGVWLEEGRLVG